MLPDFLNSDADSLSQQRLSLPEFGQVIIQRGHIRRALHEEQALDPTAHELDRRVLPGSDQVLLRRILADGKPLLHSRSERRFHVAVGIVAELGMDNGLLHLVCRLLLEKKKNTWTAGIGG